MRLVVALAFVATVGSAEIERAQQVARSRDAERTQFHRKYLFDVPGDPVRQIEVITEFRRLVMVTEDHLRLGDQMFSRSVRDAEAALAPTRGLLTLKAQLRFHPLNTYAAIPAFRLAIGPPTPPASAFPAAPPVAAALVALDTQVTGQYSMPFKTRDGHAVSILTGATLQADIPPSRVGQASRPVGVVLDGKELVRTPIDFARFD
jgi:hypothetical protein